MCGIFGGTPELLRSDAAALLRHRGPDQAGVRELRARDGAPLLLGQTRLAIVSKAAVPTPLKRRGALIAFNGEIYNWRDLRAELERQGEQFETETDTEVALAAWLAWGPKALDRFNGMFALAIWDGESLILARDRLGKKPLFYTHGPRGLAFASELKALRRLELDEVPICRSLEFYFDEHTPFRGVSSVLPGEWLRFDPVTAEVRRTRWWTFPEPREEVVDDRAAIDEFLDLFRDACAIRRVADVPVTLFLSGGVDSALIQAVLGFETTYTVQFEELAAVIDERTDVLELGARLGFTPRILVPTRDDFLASLGEFAAAIEFPVGSLSVYPLFYLARRARADGFVVALSGEGADELFNGYVRSELLLREQANIAEDWAGPYAALCARYFGTPVERFARMASREGLNGVPNLVELFSSRWNNQRSFAQNLCAVETTLFLQPLLTMADRLSMASSLEVRNPFLDHRIVDFSTRLADRMKFRNGRGKWILRAALSDLLGSDLGVTRRKVKHGLPAPVNAWLFNTQAFERRDWNRALLGECLSALARIRPPEGAP
jgi:asparagine synthase (glutamine-hydrolysing)